MARLHNLLGLVALSFLVASASAKSLTREVPDNGYRAQYGYVLCSADHVVHPSSTAEVADAIKTYAALAKKEGKQLKIRMSRNLFHSTAVFPCPNQEVAMPGANDTAAAGSSNVLSVAILNDKLDRVVAVDAAKHQLTVGTGMDLNKLFKAATENKMSVQLMTLPFYAGLTLGGILTTASHGTGDRTTSTLADTVVEATWVDATGAVRTVTRDDRETWRAINGGLGLIGVITELKLQLTPPTNTQLKTLLNQPDTNIFGMIQELLKQTPHILVFWRPDLGRFSAFMTSIAPPEAKADPSVVMTLLPDLSEHTKFADGFKEWQEDVRDEDPLRTLMCFFPPPVSLVQSLTVQRAWARAGGRFGEDRFDVVAPTNQMQAAECDQNCLWNGPQFKGTAQDAEFAIDWDAFEPWVGDVKAIFQKDLFRNGTRTERCQGAGYIWLRFGQGTDDYLSMATGLKRPVYLQSTWLRSTQAWQYPLRYGYVPELIELMTLCKYNARPHFGKNWGRTYTHPECKVRGRYPAFDELLALQAKVDPDKVFEPPLFSKVVAGDSYKYYPGCATDYECFCAEDWHCAKDFKCVPSYALPQFKVCKPPADWDPVLAKKAASNTMSALLLGSSRAAATALHPVQPVTDRLGWLQGKINKYFGFNPAAALLG